MASKCVNKKHLSYRSFHHGWIDMDEGSDCCPTVYFSSTCSSHVFWYWLLGTFCFSIVEMWGGESFLCQGSGGICYCYLNSGFIPAHAVPLAASCCHMGILSITWGPTQLAISSARAGLSPCHVSLGSHSSRPRSPQQILKIAGGGSSWLVFLPDANVADIPSNFLLWAKFLPFVYSHDLL